MKRRVLFIQGGGQGAHDEWDSKLVESLSRALGPSYEILYPNMPDEIDPSYARWAAALKNEFGKLGDGAVLAGHSIGATILINALADEAPAFRPSGVFLIAAPFVGDEGWPSDDIGDMLDLGRRLSPDFDVHLYHGDRDDTAPVSHLDLYCKAIPRAVAHRLHDRDHQLNDDLSEVAADILTSGRGW